MRKTFTSVIIKSKTLHRSQIKR